MIDFLAVANIAVTILAKFVAKAGSKIAEKSGEEIFDLVKTKLKGDDEGEEIFRRFKKNPTRYSSVFAEIIKERAEADHNFEVALRKIVNNTTGQQDNKITQIANGENIAQIAGNNSSVKLVIGNEKKEKKSH